MSILLKDDMYGKLLNAIRRLSAVNIDCVDRGVGGRCFRGHSL